MSPAMMISRSRCEACNGGGASSILARRRTSDLRRRMKFMFPVGRNVRLQLEGVDVIHSFWVPSLAGKQDLIPGRPTN